MENNRLAGKWANQASAADTNLLGRMDGFRISLKLKSNNQKLDAIINEAGDS